MLVLLRHKLQRTRPFILRRDRRFDLAPQHGQRDRRSTSLAMSRRRMVAIEFGTFRPQRRILWVGNLWEGQIPRRELWQQVLRGERLPSRRLGIHKPRLTSWRGGGTPAILVLRSRQAPPLA